MGVSDEHEHLVGITLRRMPYFRWSESWDHDHCELCWAKFMVASDAGDPEVEHEGYANEGVEGIRDHYWWICVDCFAERAGEFGWRANAGGPS